VAARSSQGYYIFIDQGQGERESISSFSHPTNAPPPHFPYWSNSSAMSSVGANHTARLCNYAD
jgi:hypothetical protein